MSKPDIIIIGAGGHSLSCIDVIEQQGIYRIAGLVGMKDELNSICFGYSVIATDADLSLLAKEYKYVCIGIGQINSPKMRALYFQKLSDLGFQLPSIISPSAYVSRHSLVGSGTIVMHEAIINAGASIGLNCIINTRALIEHDTIIEDNCHISTGTILNGNVKVGKGSFVGSGSIIKENVTIGNHCLIGMGLCVRKNQTADVRYLG